MPWAATALRNEFIDRFRKKKELREADLVKRSRSSRRQDAPDQGLSIWDLLSDKITPDFTTWVDDALDGSHSLSEEDLAILEEELTAQARVTVLILAGIHYRVPPERWERWLDDAGFPPGFEPPVFDPDEDFSAHGFSKRLGKLADYLGQNKQTIRMRWHRARPTLQKLTIFRKLR